MEKYRTIKYPSALKKKIKHRLNTAGYQVPISDLQVWMYTVKHFYGCCSQNHASELCRNVQNVPYKPMWTDQRFSYRGQTWWSND